jgi:hypothetical protein
MILVVGGNVDLSRLTDPSAVRLALDECRRLGRDVFLAKYGFERARKYFLVVDGELFDSKAVLGAAFGFADGRALGPDEFSGGDRSAVRVLRGLGFRVETPSDWLGKVAADHVNAELAEFRRVGREAYVDRYGGSESQKFFISDGGELFDAKAVLVCAMRRATGLREISHREVEGTERGVADPLRSLGFNVISEWPITVGQVLARKAVHDIVRGNREKGITRIAGSSDVLIFSDPVRGRKYGYDRFEGFREDGSFWYTGEGTKGDQSLTSSGNEAIVEADREGLRLRLFVTDKTMATYMGEVVTGDPPFVWRRAPDVDGVERDVVVFQLVPVGRSARRVGAPTIPVASEWVPLNDSDLEVRGGVIDGRVVSRQEMNLQNRFGLWLQKSGHNVLRRAVTVPSTGVQVFPDFFCSSPPMVVEAKKSASRGYVREAIGQVLDYRNLLRRSGESETQAAILLPSRPDEDLVGLCVDLQIRVFVPDGEGFASL